MLHRAWTRLSTRLVPFDSPRLRDAPAVNTVALVAASFGSIAAGLWMATSSSSGLLPPPGIALAEAAAPPPPPSSNETQMPPRNKKSSKARQASSAKKEPSSSSSSSITDTDTEPSLFHGQCLQRQLHHPKLPYPAWDYNWDGRQTPNTTLESLSTVDGMMDSRRRGTTRHILLIRHGQYDETYKADALRHLTPLGRRQAELTGLRLSLWAKGGLGGMPHEQWAAPCHFVALHVSDMTRAKETAALIAKHLPHVSLSNPDPLLNEALPSPMIPIRPDVPNAEAEIDANHDRIEQAFRKYFHRAPAVEDDTNDDNDEDIDGTDNDDEDALKHEYEIIVGHGNVIRYFVCRALQLPPEAWLRLSVFNCSITYVTIQPNGYVSVRMVGDTGHLRYDETSFSGNHGFHW